tara:strand:+ start:1042 stop:1209 length:168 start_codon:yes stop_codon:yes gene_type:complete
MLASATIKEVFLTAGVSVAKATGQPVKKKMAAKSMVFSLNIGGFLYNLGGRAQVK